MAKKVSKTSTKKKTTKKSGASTKKTAGSGSSRASSTKKKTKKSPAKKTTKKKTVSKKVTSKKKVTKKAPVKKKAPAKKVSKKTTKKSPTKKTTRKAPAKTSTTKNTTSKKTTSKKTTKKSVTKKADTGSKKKTKKSKGDDPGAPRFRGAFGGSYDDGMAAAKRLASAAGLSGLSRASAEAKKAKSYRKVKKSPFNAEQLDEFRMMLREKRRQLVGDVSSMESEALSSSESSSHTPNHMADQGSDTYDQSLNLDLAASQREILVQIDDALVRIETGVYGVCELLGKPIKAERLRNTPWARFSIEAARMIEEDPSILKRSAAED